MQFTDGVRSSLLEFPGSLTILTRYGNDGTVEFHQLAPAGNERLFPGDTASAATLFATTNVMINADGTRLSAFSADEFSYSKADYEIEPATGELTGTSRPTLTFGLPVPPTPIEGNLWSGATLVDVHATPGAALSPDETFDYYSTTPEGAAVLAGEQSFYSIFGAPEKALFVARVRFNRGEGGIELFEAFMPDRTALLGDPDALAAYDVQFDRLFTHISASGTSRKGGIPAGQWDAGMRILLAAGATEAMGHSPELVTMVLEDLDRGWSVAKDLDSGATHSSWQPLFQSRKSHIVIDLGNLMFSVGRPEDAQDTFAHGMAHSLDAFGNDKKDGLPTFSSTVDRDLYIAARGALFEEHESGAPSVPITEEMNYAFTNVKKFWAQFSELFLSNATNAETIRAVSPELHGVLSRFYDMRHP